jgi:cyclopropane fatty-acyl-phospholipid synthase-like methyltransferase
LPNKKIRATGIRAELSVNDATKLRGINGPYDLALDIGCFHAIPKYSQSKYLRQLDRILSPNGFWLLYVFFKPSTAHSGPGIVEADMNLISSQLTLVARRDGLDDKRDRPSAWFLFQKGKRQNLS